MGVISNVPTRIQYASYKLHIITVIYDKTTLLYSIRI